MPASETFKVIASFTHYNGENASLINNAERYEIYCEADGFGRMSHAQLRRINDGWDWSHIRDSSDEGEQRMLQKLIDILGQKPILRSGRVSLEAELLCKTRDLQRQAREPKQAADHFSRRFNAAAV